VLEYSVVGIGGLLELFGLGSESSNLRKVCDGFNEGANVSPDVVRVDFVLLVLTHQEANVVVDVTDTLLAFDESVAALNKLFHPAFAMFSACLSWGSLPL
jgi:hypothetical protein